MNLKQYTVGEVTYGYSLKSKKWEFKIKDFTFLSPCPGGNEMGEKFAKIVAAGYVRTKGNGIGGLARSNIDRLLAVK